MTTKTLAHAQQGLLGNEVTTNLQMPDNQMFSKEGYELKIFMIVTVTVCFFLVIIYVLFCHNVIA